MNPTQPPHGNGAATFEQFDRLLQKLRDKQCIHAQMIADEAIIVTHPAGTLTGAVMSAERLESILQSLPPERVSSRNVAGQVTSLGYNSPSGAWLLAVDRSNGRLCIKISPHLAPPAGQRLEPVTLPVPAPSAAPVASARRPRKALAFVLCFLAVAALVGAGVYWNQQRVEESRLLALRTALKEIVLADNALALEILEIDESSHITFAEFFKRAEKNREERDDLIRRIRAIEAGPYAQEVQDFVRLMELETEFVRCAEAVTVQNMQVSARAQTLKEIAESSDEVSAELSSARESYMNAPYGDDYSERFAYEVARAKVNQTTARSKEGLAQYRKARAEMRVKMDAAALAINDWIEVERRLYPWSFAPPRNIMSILIKQKSKYIVAGSEKENSKAKTVSARSSVKEVSATTPASSPTRIRSKAMLDGERFPATRLREMTADEIAQLDDEDIRYAINEMYARFGMTFKDKNYQANFDGLEWYRPNDRWTPGQIEKQFTATERKNLAALISERDYRQGGER